MAVFHLAEVILWIHVSVTAIAFGVLRKYGDRSDAFQASLGGTDATIEKLKKDLVSDIQDSLRPLFEDPPIEVSNILRPNGQYVETPVNPVHSERFREQVSDLVQVSWRPLADLVSLREAKRSWCRSARALGWLALLVVCYELAALVAIAGAVYVCRFIVADFYLWGSVSLSGLITVAWLIAFFLNMRAHDRVMKTKEKYDTL